jgi:hypothetical protein
MKFTSSIDKYAPYLTEKDLMKIASVSKEFSKAFLPKVKEINNNKLSKEEKELESIKAEKPAGEFTIGRLGLKAIENLNDKTHIEFFKKDEIPNFSILVEYRILYQLINKEKDILKASNNEEFWKLFKEHLIKNSEKGIGDYLQNEFKNLDFSEENINKIHLLCEGNEEMLSPANIGKKEKDNPAGYINLLIKDPLEYIGINIGTAKNKKLCNSGPLNKYLEYIIKRRKENAEKLDKIISKIKA